MSLVSSLEVKLIIFGVSWVELPGHFLGGRGSQTKKEHIVLGVDSKFCKGGGGCLYKRGFTVIGPNILINFRMRLPHALR